MKTVVFYFLFCLLNLAVLFGQNSPVIKIINDDGTEISFNLSDLQEISFEEFSYSNICYIYTSDDSVKRFNTFSIAIMKIYDINKVTTLDISIKVDSLNIKSIFIPAERIDSILFKNYNNLFGRVYTNIEFKLDSLVGYFGYETGDSYPGHITSDTSSYYQKINFYSKINNIKKNNLSAGWAHCFSCSENTNKGNLDFCNDDVKYNWDEYYYGQDCKANNIFIFIDTLKYRIDSLFFNSSIVYKSSSIMGSWSHERDDNFNLVLYSLPFILENDGTIHSYIKLDDFENIKYFYKYYNSQGTSGGRNHENKVFRNFDKANGDYIIEIIIK